MKILSTEQTRALDAATISRESISSTDLMERAAKIFTLWVESHLEDYRRPVWIFVGPGNNGGDGLVTARLLHRHLFYVNLVRCAIGEFVSADFQANWERLPTDEPIPTLILAENDPLPALPQNALVVDAIFGSGLNRPVTGYWAKLIEHINAANVLRVSIDVPSGLLADAPTLGACIEAHYTFCFELPKLAFFFPENHHRVRNWVVQSIGLDADFIRQTPTSWHYTDFSEVVALYRPRQRFDHKGTFGHALLLMGSRGKGGAAILATRACLRSGAGLVTTRCPACLYEVLQISNPEAMADPDEGEEILHGFPDLSPFRAIGVGCGIGQAPQTAEMLRGLLETCQVPLLLDADALNLLATHPEWWPLVPPNTILTPHPREFERLFGPTDNGFDRIALLREKAKTYGVIIALKGAYTAIACPDGSVFFNSTGNPGMATGGSGDVLSGLIVGLLAQGYAPRDAAILGVYLHGLAGDLGASRMGQEALLAGDLPDFLGAAFQTLYSPLI